MSIFFNNSIIVVTQFAQLRTHLLTLADAIFITEITAQPSRGLTGEGHVVITEMRS
jgi:hypothetical protein